MTDSTPLDNNSTPEPEIPQLTCRTCGEAGIDFCKHCGQEFCASHQSKYNTKLCHNCVSDSNLQLETEPILDDDGTKHSGRRFKLIGEGWPNSVQMLGDLTEEEREEYIAELTIRVKEAQKTLDYSKILLSAAQFEKSYDEWSRAKAARKRREKIATQGSIRLNGKTAKLRTTATKEEILAKQLGIPIEQARLVLKALGK